MAPRAAPDESEFSLTLLSTDPGWIAAADAAGVRRIGVDIERRGKAQRQAHVPDARINTHDLADLAVVTAVARHAVPFARLNPWHDDSPAEIDRALGHGARCLMLPYFHGLDEVRRFVEAVAARAEIVLLLETPAAMARLHEISAIEGVAEIMVGLNDMHIGLRLANPMEVATSDLLRHIAELTRAAGLRFGFGGIAPPCLAGLPVSPDLLIARYAQLQATSAWISRSFVGALSGPHELADALAAWRARYRYWRGRDATEHADALGRLRQEVARWRM